MQSDPSTNWRRETEWSERHEVRRAFVRLAKVTLDRKKAGLSRLAPELSPGERQVLIQSRARLLDPAFGTHPKHGLAEVIAQISLQLDEGVGSNHDRAAWLDLMGLTSDNACPSSVEGDGRDFIIAQFSAIQARPWASPAQAIVFAAAQAAAHLTLSTTQGQDEPEVTVDLTKEFTANIKRSFIDAMEGERAHLPEGSFLDVATASMTNRRDRLGSDFAVVTGFLDGGATKYRVTLFQAKWEDKFARNQADVWHNEGRQLTELVQTQMGYYLFYPRIYRALGKERPAFLPTVRSATDVVADAGRVSGKTRRLVNTCVGASGEAAWDFASFVGQALASPHLSGFGRTFDTADEVAHILSDGRGRPLTHDVLAYDLTPGRSLNLSTFCEKLMQGGFDETEFLSVPNKAAAQFPDEQDSATDPA